MLANSVGFLLAQVRALLVEATNEESLQLQRELQLRRNDPSMHLEEEIEQLSSELENTQIEMHEMKHLKNWERILMTIEFQLFEKNFREKLQKSLTKYIKHVKEKNTIGNLWGTDEKGGGGGDTAGPTKMGKKGGMSKGKASVRQQAILKREAEKIEKHQATLKKREDKLSYQQERFREAYREFEASKKEMERKIQEEREFVRNSRLAQDKMAIILDQRKKELDTEREKINVNFHKRAEELAERENEIDARFPELSKLEGQIAGQLRDLHRTAQSNLRSLNNPHAGEEAATIAYAALKFAHAHAKEMRGHFDIGSAESSRVPSAHGQRPKSKHMVRTTDVGIQWDDSDEGVVVSVRDRPDDEFTPVDFSKAELLQGQPDSEAAEVQEDGAPATQGAEAVDQEGQAGQEGQEVGQKGEQAEQEGEGQEVGQDLEEKEKAAEEEEKAAAEETQEDAAAASAEEKEEEGGDGEDGKEEGEDGSANSEQNPPPEQEEAAREATPGEESPAAQAEEAPTDAQPAFARVPSASVAAVEVESVMATVWAQSSTPEVVLQARVQSPLSVARVDDRVLELKDDEIAALHEQCRELEKRVVELSVLSVEEQEAIKAANARQQIELDLAKQRFQTERKAFEDHVKSFTRSEEDKNLILMKLDEVSRIKQAKELTDDFEALVERRTMVEKQEEDAVKARSELMEREETVRELALKVEHALEQADSEQKEFEESILDRTRVLREKEHELKRRQEYLEFEEGKEINVLRKEHHDQVAAKEAELAQKEANIAKLEESLAKEIEKLRKNAENEVAKLLNSERQELEKREGLLEARLHDLDVQFAKVQEAGQARKLLAEAEARMAKADARMGEAQTKEIELRAAVTTLEVQQEALKAAQQGMLGAGPGGEWKLKTEYEAKVRSLHLQMKDYQAQLKALRAQLARQESRELLRIKRTQAHRLAHAPGATETLSEEMEMMAARPADRPWTDRPMTPVDGNAEDFPGMGGSFSHLEAGPEEQWATIEGPETEIERVRELQKELREKMRGMEAERKQRQQEYEEKMVRVKQREKAIEGGPHSDHLHEIELADRRHKDAMNALQVKHEAAREKLKAKTEAVRVACAEVEGQLAHLKSIRASEAKLVQHAQQLFHGLDADVSGLDANIMVSGRLANDKNISLKHLSTLLEVYRIKTANLDGAIRLRKRKGEVDPRSALPRDAVENVDAAVALKVDALTNREQGFILNAARGAARGQEDEEPDGVTLHVVEPKLFEHASDKPEHQEDTVEALPAIFLPASRARQSGNAPSKRLGGGFGGSLASNRALLRHTVSAPTGELKSKLDYYSMQGAVVQTTDSPGSGSPVKHAA